MNNDPAKDLWNIFSTNPLKAVEGAIPPRPKPTEAEYSEAYEGVPPPKFNFTEADIKEMEAELKWKREMRELEAQQAAQEEADRHDW